MSKKMTDAEVKRIMERAERTMNMGLIQAIWGTFTSLFLMSFAGANLGANILSIEGEYQKERFLADKLAEIESLSKS